MLKRLLFLASLIIAIGMNVLASEFKYDVTSGKCLSADGREGLNGLNTALIFAAPDEVQRGADGEILKVIFRNRNAECTYFSRIDFDNYLRKAEYGADYLVLEKWNFDGAKFENTEIYFYVGSVSVRGADLRGLRVGYIMFEATFDKFTRGLKCSKNEDGSPNSSSPCYWKL